MKTWTNGQLIDGKRQIDSLNFSLHYASPAIWEGIRSYTQEDGSTKVWKLKEHIDRLFDSAKIINIEIPFTKQEVVEACEKTVEANGGGDLYIRPIVYTDQDAKSVRAKATDITLDIYTYPIPQLHNSKTGIKVGITGIVRGYPQFNMQAKTSANYSVSQLLKSEMQQRGVDDIFLVDNQGYIVEATVANLFVFKNGLAMTPPNNGSILSGITRSVLMDVLDNNILVWYTKQPNKVVEKNITKADLYTADEIIVCGTYAEVVSVDEVDGRKIGDGSKLFFDLLSKEYSKLIRGVQ